MVERVGARGLGLFSLFPIWVQSWIESDDIVDTNHKK